MIKILKEKFGDNASCKHYPEENHGWVSRGDVSNETTRAAVKDAMTLALDYLKRLVA